MAKTFNWQTQQYEDDGKPQATWQAPANTPISTTTQSANPAQMAQSAVPKAPSAPSPGLQVSPTASPAAPSTPPPAAAVTAVDARTYTPPGGQTRDAFFAALTPGTPVAEAPGKVWTHTGSGWAWQDAGAGSGGTGSGTPTSPNTPTPAPSTGISVTGAGGTSGVTTGPTGTTGTAPTVPLGNTVQNPLNDLMRSRVLELLQTNPNGASITDADLAPQADAYAAARERSRRQQQNAVSERLGAAGSGSSGAADLALRQGFESAGQDTAAFNAGLVGEKLDTRRQMLENAIQVAAPLGMAEESANLQRQLSGVNAQLATMQLGATMQGQRLQERLANLDVQTRMNLANLDAQLRREGYGTTERLAAMDSELRRYGIDVQGNLGLLNAVISLMGMDQQNTQFNQNLAATLGMFGANYNNSLISGLLNP